MRLLNGSTSRTLAATVLLGAALAGCGSQSLEAQCADLDARALEASARYDAAVTAEETETAKAEWNELVYQLIDLDC